MDRRVRRAGVSHRRRCLGLLYLGYLFERPHCEILALHLCAAARGASLPSCVPELRLAEGDAGPIIDARAAASFGKRLAELHMELEEAVAHHDIGRSEVVRTEIEAIEHELAYGIGLRGPRRFGSPVERARVRVTKAIKLTIQKIARFNPSLAKHLKATVRTGTSCVYLPDPRVPIRWVL